MYPCHLFSRFNLKEHNDFPILFIQIVLSIFHFSRGGYVDEQYIYIIFILLWSSRFNGMQQKGDRQLTNGTTQA